MVTDAVCKASGNLRGWRQHGAAPQSPRTAPAGYERRHHGSRSRGARRRTGLQEGPERQQRKRTRVDVDASGVSKRQVGSRGATLRREASVAAEVCLRGSETLPQALPSSARMPVLCNQRASPGLRPNYVLSRGRYTRACPAKCTGGSGIVLEGKALARQEGERPARKRMTAWSQRTMRPARSSSSNWL